MAGICPQFVIELRSESDRLSEVEAKMEMWIANGAEVAWLIDPQRKVVEIYCPGQLAGSAAPAGFGARERPGGGFELVMARVWG